MIYEPSTYQLINAAKLLDEDLFRLGFAQLRGFSISIVPAAEWFAALFA